jgi:hypothetical protein
VSNTITAAGTTSLAPTGVSATEAPAEQAFTAISTTTTEKAILLEFEDSVCLLICTTANTHSHAIVFGQECLPKWGNSSEWGMNGYMIANVASGSYIGVVQTRGGGTLAQNWATLDSSSVNNRRAADSLGVSGVFAADLVTLRIAGYNLSDLGVMPHFSWCYSARTSRTLYKDISDRHIYQIGNTASSYIAVNWDETTLVAP